jgi:hypothetical protein
MMEVGIEQQRKKTIGKRHKIPCRMNVERTPADPAGKDYSSAAVAAAEPNDAVFVVQVQQRVALFIRATT